jgi:hypothetical protein
MLGIGENFMSKITLSLLAICVLGSSCGSKKDSNPKPQVLQNEILEELQNGISFDETKQTPMQELHVYGLIWGFKETNNSYPKSKEELLKYYSAFTNEPDSTLDESLELLAALSFEQGISNTFTISWETDENPPCKKFITFDKNKDSAKGTGWE